MRRAKTSGWYEPGHDGEPCEVDRDRLAKLLAEAGAVYLQIRQWCCAADLEKWDEQCDLRAEVTRVQRILVDVASWLRMNGHPQKAAQVRKTVIAP